MTEEQIKAEMQKPVGGALTKVEWFLLFTFVDFAMKQDNMFSSSEDIEALGKTVKRLHDQIFPPIKDSLTELEETLGVKKEIIKPSSTIIL